MGNKYYKPTSDVIDLVESTLRRYHGHLEDCNIGILFRDEAPANGANFTLGMTKKVSDEARAAGLDYHFIIWFAEDCWGRLTPSQREALVDHELMHCIWDENKKKSAIRQHDFEEFNAIIARHGLWWPGAQETRQALTGLTMPLFGRMGKVEGVTLTASGAAALDE